MHAFHSSQISIALATCNGAKFIGEQLESVFNQTINPVEIVVCDDNSSDNTIEIVRQFNHDGRIKIFVNEERLGSKRNFQKAISLCSNPYIALCDQDDVWYPHKLELTISKMKSIEDVNLPCLVFTDLEIVDDELKLLAKSFWKSMHFHPQEETFRSLLYGNVITGCTTMINQPLKKYLELMPVEAFMHDQWIGLIAYGFGKVDVVPQPTVKYRRHVYNVTAVEVHSYLSRVMQMISLAMNEEKSNSFLDSELLQAKLFYKTYAEFLNDEKKNDLNIFFQEAESGYFGRKLRKILSKRFNGFYSKFV